MKTKFCFYSQLNYPFPRTAIEAEILFAARVMQVRFLERLIGGTTFINYNPANPSYGMRVLP